MEKPRRPLLRSEHIFSCHHRTYDELEISMHVIDDCDGFAYIFFPLRASPEFHYQGNEII
jgi:hypothetical protein